MTSNGDISSKSQFIKEPDSIEHLTKQITKGGGIVLAGSAIGTMTGFVLSIVLGRGLGPWAYGVYALGMSVMGIAQSVASLGLNQGVVRFCAMYRGEGNNARLKAALLSALTISLASSVITAAILFVLSTPIAERFFQKPDLVWILRTLAFAIPFYILMGITTSFAQSFQRMEFQQGVQNLFRPVVNLGLVGLAFALGFGLTGALFAFVLSGAMGTGLGFYFVWRIFPEVKLAIRSTFDEAESLFRFSFPMMFVALFYFLTMRIDRVMLGLFCELREVGIYNAASSVALQLTLIHSSLVSISMPIISDLANKHDFFRIKEVYHVVKRWSSFGTFLLILPIIFYSKFIMSLYGSEFTQGWPLLLLLSAAFIIGTITGPTGALLQMAGKHNIELINGLLMVMTNVLFNYLLIPLYGYIGAAIATVLAFCIMNIIQVYEVYRFFSFHPFDYAHTKLIAMIVFCFLAVGATTVYATGGLKLLLFPFVTTIFILYGYKSRTREDTVVWAAFKMNFAALRGIKW